MSTITFLSPVFNNVSILHHDKPHWLNAFKPEKVREWMPTAKVVKYFLLTWEYHDPPDPSDPAWEREGLLCEVNDRNFDDDDSRLMEDFFKAEYSVPTLIVLQTIPEFRRRITEAHKIWAL